MNAQLRQYNPIKPGESHRLQKKLQQRLTGYFQKMGPLQVVLLASLIGFTGGLGSIAFKYLILLFKYIFYGATSTDGFLAAVVALPWQWRLLAPAVGGLIIGPIIYYIVPEAKGHGVPEVMEAVAVKDGVLRFLIVPLKAVVSAICIGSGGSAGREGPIVQIGAAFGSTLGRFLNLSTEHVKTLLGAGAAAGIAGTFNAPLAGVIFSIEVIIRKIKPADFAIIVIASVVGTAVANAFAGGIYAVFDVPAHQLISFWELILYAGLGLVAAAVALIYENTLYAMEHIFENLPLHPAILPGIGGLLLGLLALAIPHIQATGYPVMEQALYGNLPLQLVFVFMIAKILATIFTLGSGGSGGIFAPALFIGSMMGATYGHIINNWLPNMTGGPGSYAIVGMGAVFAGATHAPLTAIIILFEMTHDHRIILPMMFAAIISSFVTKLYQNKNIYTTKLLNRGIDIDSVEEHSILESIQVTETMTRNPVTLPGEITLREARKYFEESFYSYLPVVNKVTDELIGVLSYSQVFNINDEASKQTAQDACTPPDGVIFENENLLRALKLISQVSMKVIPVIASDGSNRLVGILARGDILDNYAQQVFENTDQVNISLSSRTRTSVEDLINYAIEPVQNQAQKTGVELLTDIEDNLPEIEVDFTKLSWVFTNLLGNAIRYCDSGSQIVVSAQKKTNGILFAVSDNGAGMDLESQHLVLTRPEADETLEKSQGLAITKEIIEKHGGQMWIESNPGEGTEVSFKIPVE